MYTDKEIEQFKIKADKWDALGAQIEKCYVIPDPDNEGEFIENDNEDDNLLTIGEIAAIAYGWL